MNLESPAGNPARLKNLDIIRGFAVLGILLMNIQSFSMPEVAYTNPTSFGDLSGVNLWVWMFKHLFADSKFISIFSMLFGVGILLFCDNLDRKQLNGVKIHRRRMSWLLLFGLIHAYFIWDGDILVTYALCGFIVVAFRHSSSRKLWLVGSIFLAISFSIILLPQALMPYMTLEDIAELNIDWLPDQTIIEAEIARMTGPWLPRFITRAENSFFMQSIAFISFLVWRVGGLMLIGMAIYKQGVFERSSISSAFIKRATALFTLGSALVISGVVFNFNHQWSIEKSLFLGSLFNAIGSVLIALSYIYFWVLIEHHQWFTGLTRRLAFVGRMAFTNYLSQSLICTFLFYGWGLGLFGQVARWQQLLVVFAIWILQLSWSAWYLQRFSQGPLEWVWRRLTYWK